MNENTTQSSVLVVVDARDDTALLTAVTEAAARAAEAGATLVLYDREEETWGDTPHPEGPLDPSDDRVQEREHLGELIDGAEAAGCPVKAWLPTLPAIENITVAAHETGATLIVVPRSMKGRLADRIRAGSTLAETIARLLAADPESRHVEVLSVAEDGSTEAVVAQMEVPQ